MHRPPLFRRRRAAASALVVATVLGAAAVSASASVSAAATPGTGASGAHAQPRAVFGSDWPVYHQDALGSGVDPTGTDLTPATAAWTSTSLDGQIYGEPLVEAGRVIVATENDTVYELAANTGAVLWSTHVGTAVPSGMLPCTNINPSVGITGTPVIDPIRGEVFAVTDEVAGSSDQHFLVGLDLYTGAVLLHQAVSLPGADQLAQLQRTGLTLDDGNVVEGFGGNAGDCGNYHGWVVSIPEGGGAEQNFQVASQPGDSQGAIWMGGGAPVVDSQGNVWVATGNSAFSSSGDTYDDSDGVLELSPSMQLLQAFAPSTWYSDNGSDLDLGSSTPALIPADGLAFQAGKSNVGFLLSQAALGGISGELKDVPSFCSQDVDGGVAVSGTTVYEPCQAGVVATATAAPNNASVLWHTNTGAGGPPIVAGGLVWSIDTGNSKLYGLNATTGASVQSLSLGSEANDFPTPSVADGLLLAPSSDQVHAFHGPAGLPPPPTPAPARAGYWTTASDGGVFSFGGAPFYGSMGGKHLVAPVVGMTTTSDKAGYWLVASDGGIFSFGDAGFSGSMGGQHLDAPMVGIVAAPDGGYWTVARDGGVFSFGGAGYYGSMGGKALAAPIVGMAASPDGRGYWLVASDGGVFAFGGAGYFGSMGGRALARPVVAATPTSDGQGYWEVASDGGIFAFGDAPFEGSVAGEQLVAPMVAVAAPPLP